MTDFSVVSSILSFIAVVISILIGYGTIRQRLKEPSERRWQDWEKWRSEIDDRLDRDYQFICLSKKRRDRENQFKYIMLSSMKSILMHLAIGNHNEEMSGFSRDIDEYLKMGLLADDDSQD
jgi:hypothetical protein